jgi:hypothetical protein
VDDGYQLAEAELRDAVAGIDRAAGELAALPPILSVQDLADLARARAAAERVRLRLARAVGLAAAA